MEKFNLFNKIAAKKPENEGITPIFFRLENDLDVKLIIDLIEKNPDITLHDTIDYQLIDLMRCLFPSLKPTSKEIQEAVEHHLQKRPLDEYGVWVYYPWSRQLVHILDEEEFIEVRTNRNRNKISKEEQVVLSQKKIGVIGLSVGQTVATTIALERLCGELYLADYDQLDLSNLNRIKSSIASIGVPKTTITARQIAEIDPFLKVKTFNQGITEQNMINFLLPNGKLDLLIEECDTFIIKILTRLQARANGIPVIMDTSDKGLIDIERFDLEPLRPILHGLLLTEDLETIKGFSKEEQLHTMLKSMQYDNFSDRLKQSLPEIGKTIVTWPQTASSVVSGGGLTAEISRKILLNTIKSSGRHYINSDKIQ